VVGLTAEFLETPAGNADVAFSRNTSPFSITPASVAMFILIESADLTFPLRVFDTHPAAGFDILGLAIEAHLAGLQRHLLTLDFDVAAGLDLICAIGRRYLIRGDVDLAAFFLPGLGGNLSGVNSAPRERLSWQQTPPRKIQVWISSS
jgi:hypothetical protein